MCQAAHVAQGTKAARGREEALAKRFRKMHNFPDPVLGPGSAPKTGVGAKEVYKERPQKEALERTPKWAP